MVMNGFIAWLSESWWAGVQGITSIIGLLSIVAVLADYFAKKRRITKPNIEVWYLGNSQGTKKDQQNEPKDSAETPNQTGKGVLNIENTGGSAVTIVLLALTGCRILDFEKEIPKSVLLPGDHFALDVSRIGAESKATIGWIAHNDSRIVVFNTMNIRPRGSRLLARPLPFFEKVRLRIQRKWWFSVSNLDDIGKAGEVYVRTRKKEFEWDFPSIHNKLRDTGYIIYYALDALSINKE